MYTEERKQAFNRGTIAITPDQGKQEDRFDATRTPTFWFWKSVAIRQRQERLVAEEEQRVLTITAQVQATYIRTLTGIVRKR
ncbi:hypothetical protein JG688_00015753 [Phytophthora aleatoria]|uniref:Uncharacterized protein n=1 Tax=Phytophthora aleatoria TaxID=2496075 RepID=A0A8J5LWM5_9STRA|nr:hypothetical protein JG688_00015753 [Phytophthora aleatoria]